MSKPTGYRLNITTDEGELIGSVMLDGYDLRKASAAQALVGDIASEMGTEHIENCADLPGLDD